MLTSKGKIVLILWFVCIFGLIHSVESYGAIEYNELITFAKQLESSISSGSPYYFNLCFDTDAIIDKVINKDKYKVNEDFAAGFVEGIKQECDFGGAIIQEIRSGGSFRFVRAYQEYSKSKILFRLISDFGINYHEYEVESHNGKLVIVDGYIFLSAQNISKLFEDLYDVYLYSMHMLPESSVDCMAENSIRYLAIEGKNSKAFRKLHKLPDDIRYLRSYQLLGISVAEKLNKKKYFGTYIEFLQQFPEEPGKYMVSLNGLIQHGYYQAALVSIDKLDELIQYDPLLNFLRAQIHYKIGNLKNAEDCLYQLIESVPDFEKGYFSLLSIYLDNGEFDKATYLLDKMILTFNTYKEYLSPFLTQYEDFINSDEYKNWMKN
jgi:hypothetical protein